MEQKTKNAIEEYQCPGCTRGSSTACYQEDTSLACKAHSPGTFTENGVIFLGLPKGFNRLGPIQSKYLPIQIYNKYEDGWLYDDIFNIPVWKHLNELGHTLVRGLSPRSNMPWLHIYLENCLDKVNCVNVTQKEINEMD